MSTESNNQPAANEPGSLVSVTSPVATEHAAAPASTDPENEIYPEQKNAWYFNDKADKSMGIETYRYDNGSVSKRCTFSDGREAVCHRLKGKDRHIINRIVGDAKNKGESYKDALIVVCTKINGQGFVIEDLDALWYDDLVKLQSMATDLNFM